MHRVLVTGATGLVGRQLLPQLAHAGYDVHALAHRREVPDDIAPLATWHIGDLGSETATRRLLASVGPSQLLHLAWPATTGNLHHEVHHGFFTASQTLIREFYRQEGERVVVAGTCFEYDWSDGLCSEETTPTLPNTLYGACKDALRQFTQTAAAAAGRSWAWGRIFFVYGPHQDRTRFVPAIVHGLLEGQPVRCTDGRQVRDYLHATDAASGLLRLLESGFEGVCNIASGEATTLRDIAAELSELLGGHALLQFGARPTPPDEPSMILADTTRLRGLGWQPRFTLREGLGDTVAAFRNAPRTAAVL